MGKQWLFNVKGCITQGGNGIREQATKKDDNQPIWPRNEGGTVVPYGTGWPCHFAVHRAMGSSLCTVEGICEDGMEARLLVKV